MTDTAAAEALRVVVNRIIGERQPVLPGHGQTSITDAQVANVAQHLHIDGIRPEQMVAGGAVQAAPGASAPEAASTAARWPADPAQVATMGAERAEPGQGRAAAGQARAESPTQQAGAAAQVVSLAGLPALLPRLSEYRIAQVGKSASAFEREQEKFWQASAPLSALREEIQRVARERGLPLQDIVEKMKPDGEFAQLRVAFNNAVADCPQAGLHKKAMDKALDSYTRQYGRAQEEILNPDLHDNPHYDALKTRLVSAHDNMLEQAARMPAPSNEQGGLAPGHFDRLTQSVEKIMERIDEVGQEFATMMRAKRGDDNGPTPGP